MRQQINLIPSESRRVWVFFLPPFSLSFCITAIKCFALAGGDPYTPPRLSFSTAICQGNVTTDAPGYQTASERRAEQQIRPARPQLSVKAGRWRVQVQQDFCLNPIVKLPDSLGCDKQPAKSIRTRAEKKPKKKTPLPSQAGGVLQPRADFYFLLAPSAAPLKMISINSNTVETKSGCNGIQRCWCSLGSQFGLHHHHHPTPPPTPLCLRSYLP